jgi:hypothetical protein
MLVEALKYVKCTKSYRKIEHGYYNFRKYNLHLEIQVLRLATVFQ